jgi:hypothetical protein
VEEGVSKHAACGVSGAAKDLHILQPTSWRLWRFDPLALHDRSVSGRPRSLRHDARTNDERNHGGSISSGRFESLDQFLDLPDLDVLLGLVRLRVTHDGRK